jgi:hypothetical protein
MKSDLDKLIEAKTILESLAVPGFSWKACKRAVRRAQRSARSTEREELKILESWLEDVRVYFRP